MATNYPGPYEIRFTAVAAGFVEDHEFRMSLNLNADPAPGDDFDTIEVLNHDSTTDTLDITTEALLGLIVDIYNTNVAFPLVELWRYTAGTFDAFFISAYAPTADQGMAGGGITPASQAILTFRSSNGGIAKLVFNEATITPGVAVPISLAPATILAIALEFAGDHRPFVARDNGRPFAPLRYLPGQNERLWKQINR
jgi:hypothetical protein